MRLTFASYNIHKGVGLDRRRDPERIVAVLRELDADVIALQECDMRFGTRESVLPRGLIEEFTPWRAAPVAQRAASMGWHGNALLVRQDIAVSVALAVPLPMLEPRGAVRADLIVAGAALRVVGMHLDISGLRRHHQIRSVVHHVRECEEACPAVLMGDLNDWSRNGRAVREFGPGDGWRMVSCGASFPARRPIASLDRIVVSREWTVESCGVHRSALAARASDHLPVWARLRL